MFKFLTLFLLIVGIYSCQKEISSENPLQQTPTPTSIASDSIYLSKIKEYRYNATYSTILDSSITLYNYDNLKRVIQVKFKENLIPGPDTVATTYYYMGSNMQPYKFVSIEQGAVVPLATKYFFYDNLNRIIKDSLLEQGDIFVQEHKYTSGFIFSKISYYLTTVNDSIYYYDTARIDNKGNIADHISWRVEPNSTLRKMYVDTYAYDTNKSPFLNVNTKYCERVISFDGILNSVVNNLQQAKNQSFLLGIPSDSTVSYFTNTYNSNNYLKETRERYVPTSPWTPSYWLTKYFYISL
jgi:hypothetical protein